MMIAKYKFRMKANVIYELTNFGYIKACSILDTLLENEKITKKKENVATSIENLQYDGHDIVKAEYDALMNEVILYIEV